MSPVSQRIPRTTVVRLLVLRRHLVYVRARLVVVASRHGEVI